jgi:predicted phage tail component-like protein
MSTVVTLNGVDSDVAVSDLEILRVRRGFLGARRDVFVEVPGRPGSWAFREEPGDREISITCDIQSSSFANRRAAVRSLANWADTPAGPVRLIVDDEPDRFWLVMVGDPYDPEEWLNYVEDFDIVWRASPYAQATAISTETIAGAGSDESGTFDIPDELVTPLEIAVTPTNGTLTGLEVLLNGDTLEWVGSVADDATLTISSISSTVVDGDSIDAQLVGRYDPTFLDMAGVSGDFPLLIPDTNVFDFDWTGTATAVTFDLRWRRRYR